MMLVDVAQDFDVVYKYSVSHKQLIWLTVQVMQTFDQPVLPGFGERSPVFIKYLVSFFFKGIRQGCTITAHRLCEKCQCFVAKLPYLTD